MQAEIHQVEDKLISNSTLSSSKQTLSPITTVVQAHHWMCVLAPEICLRLREVRKENNRLWPRALSVSARQRDPSGRSSTILVTRQAPLPPSFQATVEKVVDMADKLIAELVSDHSLPFSSIGISFVKIEEMEKGQRNLDSFLRTVDDRPPLSKAWEASVLESSGMYGASLVAIDDSSSSSSFTCPRCGSTIELSTAWRGMELDNDILRGEALAALRQYVIGNLRLFHLPGDIDSKPQL
jgi:hypothetical protein